MPTQYAVFIIILLIIYCNYDACEKIFKEIVADRDRTRGFLVAGILMAGAYHGQKYTIDIASIPAVIREGYMPEKTQSLPIMSFSEICVRHRLGLRDTNKAFFWIESIQDPSRQDLRPIYPAVWYALTEGKKDPVVDLYLLGTENLVIIKDSSVCWEEVLPHVYITLYGLRIKVINE